jgi:hypothetical protein
MENVDLIGELELLPSLNVCDQRQLLTQLNRNGEVQEIDQGDGITYFIILSPSIAKTIIHNSLIFQSYPSGELLPLHNDVNRRVLSMIEGDLHTEMRFILLKQLKQSYERVCHSIDNYLDQGIAEVTVNNNVFEFTTSVLGNVAPLAVCTIFDIPVADQWKLVQLFQQIISTTSIEKKSVLTIEFSEYLSFLLTFQINQKDGALFHLYSDLIDRGDISFEDALHNIYLLFEASLYTVTSVMVNVLIDFSNQDITSSDKELSTKYYQAFLNSLPINFIHRRCDKNFLVSGRIFDKDAIVVIPVALFVNESDNVKATEKAVFGMGNHSCPGKIVVKEVLQRFIKSIYKNVRKVEIVEISRNENKVSTIYDKVLVRFVGI